MERYDFNQGKLFHTHYLNHAKTRWVRLDNYGNKDKITLTTVSGKLITRTCQYHEETKNGSITYITYKGKGMKVTPDTVLGDWNEIN